MVNPHLIEQAKNSSVDERLAIIGELWDSIDHSVRPTSASTFALVEERVAEAKASPLSGRAWAEIKTDRESEHPV